jgi:phosphatidylserine decarboxylase
MVIAGFAGGVMAAAAALPLAWKWQLGTRTVLVGLLKIAVLAGALTHLLGVIADLSAPERAAIGAGVTLTVAFAVLLYRFYRDPERTPPRADNVVVSPADGSVVYIRRARDGHLPVSTKRGSSVALKELTRTDVHAGDAVVVGIGMTLLDVHVNRAPVAGRVTLRKHFPGRFGSLRVPEMEFENERATTMISGDGIEVAVVQIASRLVRQIAGFVGEGEQVELGQRIGAIRLGSQVDLVVPDRPGLSLHVQVGDRVEAGTTIIATLAREACE